MPVICSLIEHGFLPVFSIERKVKPILTVEPSSGYLFNAKWSPSRPLVFYLATSDGKLLIYDLKVNSIRPVQTLEVNNEKNPIFAFEFNPQRPQLLATGDSSGVTRVWSLSSSFTSKGQGELDALDKLAATALE